MVDLNTIVVQNVVSPEYGSGPFSEKCLQNIKLISCEKVIGMSYLVSC